jgi:hypothetical protein
MEELKVIIKEVVETPSILGSYENMPIINILRKYLIFSNSNLENIFRLEFESFLQRLDRAEKMGIKPLDRINTEIKEWNERIEDDEFGEIILQMTNKTVSELFSANQPILDNTSIGHIMQMLVDEENDDLKNQIIGDVGLLLNRYNQEYFDNPFASKNGIDFNSTIELMETQSITIFEKVNLFSDFFGLTGILSKQVIKVSENILIKMFQMEYFDKLVEYRDNLGYESNKDTAKSLTIPIKIKGVKKGREIDLEQDAYAILIHYFKKSRIFLSQESHISDVSASKAMQILSGYQYDNIRKKVGSLDFTYNQRVGVKEKLQEVIDLINKDIPKK